MARLPTVLLCGKLLLGTTVALAADGGAAGPGAAPMTDAGTPALEDGGTVVDPSRLAEARALVPPPLLYGTFQPVVGTWVEYEFSSKQGRFPVRAAVVGEAIRREDGSPLYQVELDYGTKPRTLVVVWVIGGTRPMVERLAVSVPPNAPISIPVDLYMDQPELRGALTAETDTELRGGAFAGRARQRTFRRETGAAVTVVSTPKVPVFGVESIRDTEATWVARKTGTGARPELGSVPIAIPRTPGQ
ncbi:hypothetical protein [Pyxidicoccus caerfyrddinensis]|uniref:hypothetical protein n=1 Tax=Pyxidicoccus caerfyrddinensis TaxID=2709663 RepID=UPI0013DCEEAF|nr:hypothetical protein [Pyxidicoccus caerfyrddinensis]